MLMDYVVSPLLLMKPVVNSSLRNEMRTITRVFRINNRIGSTRDKRRPLALVLAISALVLMQLSIVYIRSGKWDIM